MVWLVSALSVLALMPWRAVAMQANTGTSLTSMSATEVVSMLNEFGITSEIQQSGIQGSPLVVATTTGGAKFLVGFLNCKGTGTAARCGQAMVTTMQSSAGIAFEDLNGFNGTANVTTVVYEPEQRILIFGRNIFTPGGIGRENFKLQVALFLSDMQRFMTERSSTATSIAFTTKPDLTTKIDSLNVRRSHSKPVGTQIKAEAPRSKKFQLSEDGKLEVELAIANARGVNYDFDNPLK